MPRDLLDWELGLGTVLTLGLAVLIGAYGLREPQRLDTATVQLHRSSIARGATLYQRYCVTCHGANGKGIPQVAPALNDKNFLATASVEAITDAITDGRPNTAMPAWGQRHGGPLNAQHVQDLVAFIQNWEKAEVRLPSSPLVQGDPVAGKRIFDQVCYLCHGENGEGGVAPALNNQEFLRRYDDAFIRETVTKGRPSKGMPTWGKVFSAEQIADVTAYIRSWQQGATLPSPSPASAPAAESSSAVERGKALYQSLNCAACHRIQGEGGTIGPDLSHEGEKREAAWLLKHFQDPRALVPDSVMPAFGHLSPEDLEGLVAYMRSLR